MMKWEWIVSTDLFGNEKVNHSLRGRYNAPPFSVLDTKQGDWIKRKRKWLSLGIKSEVGRNSPVFKGELSKCLPKYGHYSMAKKGDVSVFDPVLTEIMYKWFCIGGGLILDPFAGGSVRGIIAHYLGYRYVGLELRQEQITSNVKQAHKIIPDNPPEWHIGDSAKILKNLPIPPVDFIFSCPPYMNLEKYSDDPADLSNMDDPHFILKYEKIIRRACKLLKQGCYACFVVGDIRDKDGNYKDFVTITKQAFYKAGLKLYNEAILLNIIGSACLRTHQFEKNRKLVKIHQNVLIFRK
jgi:DNA modification methylase